MTRRPRTHPTDTFQSDWRRWTAIVELIARTGSGHHPLHRREYQALYQRLIAASRERAGSGDEATRSVYQEVEATVRPWMTPQILEQADGEILSDLLDRCRRIDGELGVRRLTFRQNATWVLVFLTVSAVSFAVLWATRDHWPPLAFTLQSGARGLWHTVWRLGEVEKLFIFGAILILFSIYNTSRAART